MKVKFYLCSGNTEKHWQGAPSAWPIFRKACCSCGFCPAGRDWCLIPDPGAAKSKDRPQPLTAEPSAQGLGLLKTLLMPKAMETGWVWTVKELFTPHSNGKIITDKGAIAFEPAVITDQLVTVVLSSSDLLWGLDLEETKCGVGTAFSLC